MHQEIGAACIGGCVESVAHRVRCERHRDSVVAVTGGGVETAQLVARQLERIRRCERALADTGQRQFLNAGADAGASSSASSSSWRNVTVTEAPAISSEVMNSPT